MEICRSGVVVGGRIFGGLPVESATREFAEDRGVAESGPDDQVVAEGTLRQT